MAPIDRRTLGSWLEGPRAAAEQQGVVFRPRGERIGLPAEGPGSVAPLGRRLVGLLVDWFISGGVVQVAGGRPQDAAYGWAVLAVFAVLSTLSLAFVGRTPGHALLRLRLVDLRPRGPQALRVLLRQLLVCLVIPAVIWDADGRGLHDKAAGTVLVRR
ncbi:RDD family protein [Motilibacter rhizosphaerae]|uniref:RDD family protein n=1 Tax=Motilibacter rhizosphaerae TaxID=598652 RepID=A0A4V2F4K1_9ACTN|nr:RDD family protein [Motilibacter rhizosphaerae]RZS89599.1 RDD family protein [Motilibacter rhizosphaerae]